MILWRAYLDNTPNKNTTSWDLWVSVLIILLKQVEQFSQLPKPKQKFVMDRLDTVIKQAAH